MTRGAKFYNNIKRGITKTILAVFL